MAQVSNVSTRDNNLPWLRGTKPGLGNPDSGLISGVGSPISFPFLHYGLTRKDLGLSSLTELELEPKEPEPVPVFFFSERVFPNVVVSSVFHLPFVQPSVIS